MTSNHGKAIVSEVGQLVYVARNAAEHQETLIAVVFSAIWLEGYVNDLIETIAWYAEVPAVKLPTKIRAVADICGDVERQRAQLPEKVQLLSLALRGRTFDRGAAPFQDFDLLLAIRHRIVHPRPFRVDPHFSMVDEPKKIRQGLIDRSLLDRDSDTEFPWTVALSGPDCGMWAYNTAWHMSRAIADCFPRGPWRTWAHASNPLSPESTRRMRRARRAARGEAGDSSEKIASQRPNER